jgi:hypothetical protein
MLWPLRFDNEQPRTYVLDRNAFRLASGARCEVDVHQTVDVAAHLWIGHRPAAELVPALVSHQDVDCWRQLLCCWRNSLLRDQETAPRQAEDAVHPLHGRRVVNGQVAACTRMSIVLVSVEAHMEKDGMQTMAAKRHADCMACALVT